MKYVGFCLYVFCCIAISACSDQNNGPGQIVGTINDNDNPDYVIAVALYTDQRIPKDFYHNEPPDDNAFYITYHVKNSDLVPISDRTGMATYELSTNDYSQALDWAETAAALRPVYRPVIDYTETDLYFQFTRVDINYPLLVELERVLKSSVVDRSGVDLTKPDEPFQGTINLDVLSADVAKQVIEYLWTFSLANNYGTLITKSETADYSSVYVHTLQEARLDMYTGDSCDTISIYNINYKIDKTTGEINKEEHFLRKFQARRTDSGYEICYS